MRDQLVKQPKSPELVETKPELRADVNVVQKQQNKFHVSWMHRKQTD